MLRRSFTAVLVLAAVGILGAGTLLAAPNTYKYKCMTCKLIPVFAVIPLAVRRRSLGACLRNLETIWTKPELIEKLEELLEQAIADALDSKKLEKLPVKPPREITHLMANAVVAVYHGAVEGRER
jgi:hypothetical protein